MEFTVLYNNDDEIVVPAEDVLPYMVDGWAFGCNYSAASCCLTGDGWQVWTNNGLVPIADAIASGLCVKMGPDERELDKDSIDEGDLYEGLNDQDINPE